MQLIKKEGLQYVSIQNKTKTGRCRTTTLCKDGIANTTMNDIAVASGKGRRTLYTYFSRKEDVYYAVIESELERLSDKLDEVANCKMRPQDKIIELIYTHLSMIKETVVRNGNLRAEFFRNIWMVEKARKTSMKMK